MSSEELDLLLKVIDQFISGRQPHEQHAAPEEGVMLQYVECAVPEKKKESA